MKFVPLSPLRGGRLLKKGDTEMIRKNIGLSALSPLSPLSPRKTTVRQLSHNCRIPIQ